LIVENTRAGPVACRDRILFEWKGLDPLGKNPRTEIQVVVAKETGRGRGD
jgi:hypothetical protein